MTGRRPGQRIASALALTRHGSGVHSGTEVAVNRVDRARSGAQTTVVPDKPIRAIVYHYAAPYSPGDAALNGPTMLTKGSAIASDQIDKLTAVLNTLKAGRAGWNGLPDACAGIGASGRMSWCSGALWPW